MAAGGGGDAVGALLARRALGDTDARPPLVTTCAWERLRIDPVPGPRARSDFKGLGLVGGEQCEVLPTSDTNLSGRSVLPRLAETSRARIYLHDFTDGAVGLAAQLQRLAESLGAERLAVIDVGGDIVARGHEPTLRSPLADSLTLAAAIVSGIPTSVSVIGPGADAELSQDLGTGLLQALGAKRAGRIRAEDAAMLQPVLSWHPTEATAVVAAAASGTRGYVAIRRIDAPVPVNDRTTEVWSISHPSLVAFPLALALSQTETLVEAEQAMRAMAVNEIDFERDFASRENLGLRRLSLAEIVGEMRAAGATHISDRRLSELSRPSDPGLAARCGPGPHRLWSRNYLAKTLKGSGLH